MQRHALLAECCIYNKKTCLDTLDTCTDLEPQGCESEFPLQRDYRTYWIFQHSSLHLQNSFFCKSQLGQLFNLLEWRQPSCIAAGQEAVRTM